LVREGKVSGKVEQVARVRAKPLDTQNPIGQFHSELLRRMFWARLELKTEIPV
jgi:hypothetical protein